MHVVYMSVPQTVHFATVSCGRKGPALLLYTFPLCVSVTVCRCYVDFKTIFFKIRTYLNFVVVGGGGGSVFVCTHAVSMVPVKVREQLCEADSLLQSRALGLNPRSSG